MTVIIRRIIRGATGRLNLLAEDEEFLPLLFDSLPGIRIVDPNNREIVLTSFELNSDGSYSYDFVTTSSHLFGNYRAIATGVVAGKSASIDLYFQVI